MKIVALGGSNSENSINRRLAYYVATLFENAEIDRYDVSAQNLPIYSIQEEKKNGIHPIAVSFAEKIDAADLIVISLAENNSSFNAGFKSLIDWTSRIKDRKVWNGKPMLLMATSPGGRGGKSVLELAGGIFPRMGADIKATFSLPQFQVNFDDEKGITDETLRTELKAIISQLQSN